jgi:hypothetical protein
VDFRREEDLLGIEINDDAVSVLKATADSSYS